MALGAMIMVFLDMLPSGIVAENKVMMKLPLSASNLRNEGMYQITACTPESILDHYS
jgi:hypothetical protein